jgi:hypothetical protein
MVIDRLLCAYLMETAGHLLGIHKVFNGLLGHN